jgi:phosphoglycerate dehydrogenase-like enzyme
MGAAHITGISRSGVARDPIFDAMLPISRLEEILPETEILIMALPGTAETAGVMDARRIAMLPENAVIVNVGRGNSLDQYAVRDALNEGRLAGAAIDVFLQEPIPQDDVLWGTKNLIITPHVAGNLTLRHTALKNAAMFCEDLENYAAGRPLKHLVDRKRGY